MNILFVCSGNTCRSPMAEVIALDKMRAEGDFASSAVTSAGMAAHPGDGAMPGAQRVSRQHGLDLSAHRAKALTTDLIAASDHIYTMTLTQAAQLRQILPEYAARIAPLIEGMDVRDPYGQSDAVYEACFGQIEEGIAARLEEWKIEQIKENE